MTNIEAAIRQIDAVDLKEETAIDQIQNIVATKLRKLPAFLTDLKPGEAVVRSRFVNDNEDFHRTIGDYSYHPDPTKVKIGRANFPGQQIFYGSRYRITSLAEARLIHANCERDFARYSLGRWDVQGRIPLAAIVTPEQIRRYNAKELFGLADFIEETERQFNYDPEIRGFIDIYRYMAEKYMEPVSKGDEYKYKLTATFSNFIYGRLPVADGILYQSVRYPEHFNIALKREAVDQSKLKLVFAAQQRYEREGNMNYREVESISASSIDYDSATITWPVLPSPI